MRRLAALASLAVMAAILLARWRRATAQAPLDAAAEPSAIERRPAALPAPAPEPPVAPTPPASAFLSVPWVLDDDVSPGRSELAIRCRLDAGLTLDRVDAQETPTQVFVTALARAAPPGEADAGPREQAATVTLSGPLAARELIHAPVDARDAS